MLQTGRTPHPVYIPTGQVRRLCNLLSRKEAVAGKQRQWLLRARAHLEAAGYKVSMHVAGAEAYRGSGVAAGNLARRELYEVVRGNCTGAHGASSLCAVFLYKRPV